MKIKRNPRSTRGQINRKPKVNILKQKMSLAGVDFFKMIIQGNTPAKEGMYLIFYDGFIADSNVKKQAGMQITNFSKGKWGTSYTPLAYMGPLPVLSLPALQIFTPGYLINQRFYIATFEQAVQGFFDDGPHIIYIMASMRKAKAGHFIFCIDSDHTNPYPVAKALYRKKDDTWIWSDLSVDVIKKYSKMLDSLR